MQQREVKKLPTLRGRTVVNLFFEDSTRTRSSFEIAGQVAVGRRHQHQRQGLLDLQGRVAARHRADRRGDGGRRPGHPAPRERGRPPGQPVGRRPRHQRRRRHARAPDPGPARRLHDGAPARRPRGPPRRDRRRPDPLAGGALQPDHPQDPRRPGHPGRAPDPDAERHHRLGAGRGLRAVPRLRRGAAHRRRGDDAAGPARADERRVLPDGPRVHRRLRTDPPAARHPRSPRTPTSSSATRAR